MTKYHAEFSNFVQNLLIWATDSWGVRGAKTKVVLDGVWGVEISLWSVIQ